MTAIRSAKKKREDEDQEAERRGCARTGWPQVLAEGDSWFAHPVVWNILFHLADRGGYAIRRLASIGDELADMVRESPDHRPE